MALDEVYAQALTLLPEERIELAERLFDSVEDGDTEAIAAAWIQLQMAGGALDRDTSS